MSDQRKALVTEARELAGWMALGDRNIAKVLERCIEALEASAEKERNRIAGLIWEEEQECTSAYNKGVQGGMDLLNPGMLLLNGRGIGLQRARDIAQYGSRNTEEYGGLRMTTFRTRSGSVYRLQEGFLQKDGGVPVKIGQHSSVEEGFAFVYIDAEQHVLKTTSNIVEKWED